MERRPREAAWRARESASRSRVCSSARLAMYLSRVCDVHGATSYVSIQSVWRAWCAWKRLVPPSLSLPRAVSLYLRLYHLRCLAIPPSAFARAGGSGGAQGGGDPALCRPTGLKAMLRGMSPWWWWWGGGEGGRAAGGGVLQHPAARGGRNLLLPVARHQGLRPREVATRGRSPLERGRR